MKPEPRVDDDAAAAGASHLSATTQLDHDTAADASSKGPAAPRDERPAAARSGTDLGLYRVVQACAADPAPDPDP